MRSDIVPGAAFPDYALSDHPSDCLLLGADLVKPVHVAMTLFQPA
jgi:hypothetical protein